MAVKGEEKEGILKRFGRAAGEFLYGMTTYESVQFALGARERIDHIFILMCMGDLLGVPILRPYYSLRIFPHVAPKISNWKRLMLREKDLTDGADVLG